jgi:hypothetical protein
MNLPLKCKCGAVTGHAEYSHKSDIKRFVCMCGDCQTFPQFLGNPESVLDKNGGTEIIPAFHWQVHLATGSDQLRSVRLSDDGLLRWYTACCRTPVGNSMSNKMPYMGLVATLVDVADREREFGPVAERLMGSHGIGPLPPSTRKTNSIPFMLYVLKFIIKGILSRKGRASIFFLPGGGPTSPPTVLSDDEYIRLRARTSSPWRAP